MIPGDGSRGEMIPEDDEPMFHRSSARVVIEQRTVQLNQTNNNNTNAIEGTSMDTILGRTISQESCEDVRSNLSCSTIIRRRHTQSENLHELNNDTTTLSRSNTMPVRKKYGTTDQTFFSEIGLALDVYTNRFDKFWLVILILMHMMTPWRSSWEII